MLPFVSSKRLCCVTALCWIEAHERADDSIGTRTVAGPYFIRITAAIA
jgi:hypothetical protein